MGNIYTTLNVSPSASLYLMQRTMMTREISYQTQGAIVLLISRPPILIRGRFTKFHLFNASILPPSFVYCYFHQQKRKIIRTKYIQTSRSKLQSQWNRISILSKQNHSAVFPSLVISIIYCFTLCRPTYTRSLHSAS
jgi:hypothetical protein